jgi:putative membrane protein
MLNPVIQKNDKRAGALIIVLSLIVFVAVALLSRLKLELDLGFDVHIFATVNALINSTVSVLLLAALVAVKNKKYLMHKKLMLAAMLLSALFLVSYIAHHLLSDPTPYGGEGTLKTLYYILLVTHIFLAAVILPFILYTVYRGLTGEFARHKKMGKMTWPVWFYVSVSGVLVYLMISPYYG